MYLYIWLVVWNMTFIFPYIGNNHPSWLSYFSEGLKPPTRLYNIIIYIYIHTHNVTLNHGNNPLRNNMLLKDLNAYLWTALGIAWDQSNTHVDTSTKTTEMWYYFAWSQPSDICPDISYSHTVQVWLIYPHISSEIYPAAYFLKYLLANVLTHILTYFRANILISALANLMSHLGEWHIQTFANR